MNQETFVLRLVLLAKDWASYVLHRRKMEARLPNMFLRKCKFLLKEKSGGDLFIQYLQLSS